GGLDLRGGADAEGGGTDGDCSFEEAWTEHPGDRWSDGRVAQHSATSSARRRGSWRSQTATEAGGEARSVQRLHHRPFEGGSAGPHSRVRTLSRDQRTRI